MNKVDLLKRSYCFYSNINNDVINIHCVIDDMSPITVLGQTSNGDDVEIDLDEIDIDNDVFYELVPIDVVDYCVAQYQLNSLEADIVDGGTNRSWSWKEIYNE